MSQVDNYNIPTTLTTMAAIEAKRAQISAAIGSFNRGDTAPNNPFEGMAWWDTSLLVSDNQETLKRYMDGLGWVPLLEFHTDTGAVICSPISDAMSSIVAAGSVAEALTLLGVYSSAAVDAAVATRAALASPAFTGTPTAPTPAAGDVTTKLATMANFAQGANGASLVLLGSSTANNSASVVFNGIPAAYSKLVLDFENVVPVTSGGNLLCQYSTDNGVSFVNAGYYYGGVVATSSGSTAAYGAAAAVAASLFPSVSNLSNFGVSGRLEFLSHGNSKYKQAVWQVQAWDGTNFKNVHGGMTQNSVATAANAVGFYFSSGNISSGIIRIYGVRGA